ncbi:MAG: metallophosphoesterase [Muribaculaceae bacterium]|nr:metallophosphoesterase [Muribaculaceae bacterium]
MRGFSVLSIILLFVCTILIDWGVWSTIRKYASKRKKLWSRIYSAVAVLSLALVTAICCWRGDRSGDSLTLLMWMLYVYFTIYIPKFIYLLIAGIGWIFSKLGSNRKSKVGYFITIAGAIIGVLVFIAMWVGTFYTRRHIDVEKVELFSSKLPASFDGYKIVQFSDAHVGTWGNDTTFIAKLVKEINSLNPDLVVFTGDIVNRSTAELQPFISTLSKIKAKDGVISVLGNHDYGDYMHWNSEEDHIANNQLLAQWEKDMGWDLLNNDYQYITNGTDSIVIIGVENWGEPPFHQYGELTESYLPTGNSTVDLNDGNYKILLSHNPEHWNREVTKISNINLTLAGHTHAMQTEVNLFGWKWSPAVFRYPLWGGLYARDPKDGEKAYLYVNIGCGEVGIPARFGVAYPELTEITLRREK